MDTRVEEVNFNEGVTLDLGTLTQYDGTGKCGFLRTWNIKYSKAPFYEDQDDDFEDYEQVDKWVQKMEMDWGTSRTLLSTANCMEILRNCGVYWSDCGEYEESFELDDNEEEDWWSDNEVEDVLNNSDGGEAEAVEVDSGKNGVKEDLETVKEQIHQDLANMSLSVNCVGEDEESDGWVW